MAPLNADDPRVGSVLAERYRIDALVGEGGMGKVYSAEHVMMKKRLAVKVLHRELTTVPDVVARFEREAMAAANIEHPNVAAATDFGKLQDGSVFLVLEYVQGKNLRDEIAEGPVPVERALHIARQIASGLGSAHLQGIVHRDLKPENVMLVEKAGDPDFVKVLDFGIAKVPIGDVTVPGSNPDQPITRAGMVFGTPEYMAPEQALGQTVDGRSDLYALGVILFEMLAGVRPFSSQSPVGILGQQLAKPPPTFAERSPGILIPPAVEQIVHRLLARDLEQRYANAAEVVTVLDVLLAPAPGRGGYRFTLADGSPSVPEPEALRLTPTPDVSSASAAVQFAGSREASVRGAPRDSESDLVAAGVPVSRRGALLTTGFHVLLDRIAQTGPRGAKIRDALQKIGPRAEGLRERLPPRIRDSLRPVPTRALVIAGGMSALVVGVLALAVVVALVRLLIVRDPIEGGPSTETDRSASSTSVATAATPGIPSAEFDSAMKDGPSALEALADRYPRDPSPRVEAARGWIWKKDYARAVTAVSRALQTDPQAKNDERVAAVLFQTSQNRASMDASFALLTGPMMPRGAEILWDLAGESAVKPGVRQRAAQWLRSPEFSKHAPESLRVAAELRTAKTCDAARGLLPRAKLAADERSLSQLEAWRKTTGCGAQQKADCMPCLRDDGLLEEAIAAIRARKSIPAEPR